MSVLTKRNYTNHQTVITAKNLNEIQDAILALEQLIQGGPYEHFSSLSELGLSGSVTIEEVLVALPAKGVLIMANNNELANHVSDTPGTYGVLNVLRASTYGEANWTQVGAEGNLAYKGSWTSGGGWLGWYALGGVNLPDGDGVSY